MIQQTLIIECQLPDLRSIFCWIFRFLQLRLSSFLPILQRICTFYSHRLQCLRQIPDNIPDEFLRPLEVSIQKVENDIYRDVITIGNEGTFAEGIAIDANKRYRFVVKLVGNLTDEVVETGISSRIYSEGQVIDIQ